MSKKKQPEILGIVEQGPPTEEQAAELLAASQEMDTCVFWFDEVQNRVNGISAMGSSSTVEHLKRQLPRVRNELDVLADQFKRTLHT